MLVYCDAGESCFKMYHEGIALSCDRVSLRNARMWRLKTQFDHLNKYAASNSQASRTDSPLQVLSDADRSSLLTFHMPSTRQ